MCLTGLVCHRWFIKHAFIRGLKLLYVVSNNTHCDICIWNVCSTCVCEGFKKFNDQPDTIRKQIYNSRCHH